MENLMLLAAVWIIIGGLASLKLFPPKFGLTSWKIWLLASVVSLGGLVTLFFSDRLVLVGMKTWKN